MMRALSIPCLAAAFILSATTSGFAAPKVAASIKPVHSLVAAIMGDVGTPSLVVKGGGSPHAYSLRPSEARALAGADAIFWVGPELESFLEQPLESLASKEIPVRLDRSPGMKLLDPREGGAFEAHHHGGEEGHHDHAEGHDGHDEDHDGHDDGHDEHAETHDGHDGDHHEHAETHDGHHDEKDWHVWLDPENAKAMARHIADRLSKIDPEHAGVYRANVKALEERIDAVDQRIASDLAEVRNRPFVVFHDAYHYFEDRYGLKAVASFTIDPETAPGARRLAEIRSRIRETGAQCIFAEPQFKPDVVTSVADDAGVRSGVLDPLGAEIDAGPDAWETIMLGLARSLKSCLDPAT